MLARTARVTRKCNGYLRLATKAIIRYDRIYYNRASYCKWFTPREDPFANIDELHSYEVCTQQFTQLRPVTAQAFSSIHSENCINQLQFDFLKPIRLQPLHLAAATETGPFGAFITTRASEEGLLVKIMSA